MPGKKGRKKSKGTLRGISKDYINSVNDNVLHSFGYSKEAWRAFYASPEGQARLARLKQYNDMKIMRYQKILQERTNANVPKPEALRQYWKNVQ
jgi:hypothetical protein